MWWSGAGDEEASDDDDDDDEHRPNPQVGRFREAARQNRRLLRGGSLRAKAANGGGQFSQLLQSRSRHIAGGRGGASNDDDDEEGEAAVVQEALLENKDSVLVGLQGNIYNAAFALTARSWRYGGRGTLIMAWFWVIVSVAVQWFFLYVCYQRGEFMKRQAWHQDREVDKALSTLEDAMAKNSSLDAADAPWIADICSMFPSGQYFCVVTFLFNAYLLGGSFSQCRTRFLQIIHAPSVDSHEEIAEDVEDKMIIVGLRPADRVVLTCLTVVPHFLTILAAWYTGMTLLVFTTTVSEVCTRVVLMVGVLQVDWVVFSSFLSSSKQDWVTSTQVLFRRNRCVRILISWPGELLKLALVIGAVACFYWIFRGEFALRNLCWKCAQTCDNACSSAFASCGHHGHDNGHTWPFIKSHGTTTTTTLSVAGPWVGYGR